jgi:hypothetical protein
MCCGLVWFFGQASNRPESVRHITRTTACGIMLAYAWSLCAARNDGIKPVAAHSEPVDSSTAAAARSLPAVSDVGRVIKLSYDRVDNQRHLHVLCVNSS